MSWTSKDRHSLLSFGVCYVITIFVSAFFHMASFYKTHPIGHLFINRISLVTRSIPFLTLYNSKGSSPLSKHRPEISSK